MFIAIYIYIHMYIYKVGSIGPHHRSKNPRQAGSMLMKASADGTLEAVLRSTTSKVGAQGNGTNCKSIYICMYIYIYMYVFIFT